MGEAYAGIRIQTERTDLQRVVQAAEQRGRELGAIAEGKRLSRMGVQRWVRGVHGDSRIRVWRILDCGQM